MALMIRLGNKVMKGTWERSEGGGCGHRISRCDRMNNAIEAANPSPPATKDHRHTDEDSDSARRPARRVAALLATLFGAALTLSTAYAFGALLMRKHPAPPEIVLGIGAGAGSGLALPPLLFH